MFRPVAVTLTPGTRIGPYEIAAQIGVGGMGEVYRATDTKLKRHVAIKILPASFAADPDRLARFQREAEVLASLNHPNIAAIYGLEEADGIKTLVMELVEGVDLSQALARGPMPLDEALPIAKQIAEALEAAHEQGIIHRDLKPANIKLRPDGTVKVLDFGLAKAMEPTGAMSTGASELPTITTPAMTQARMILGTAAYMSPEQASGKPVDKRADIWAFGVVLSELLTGQRVFGGETISHTLAAILTKEPDLARLPARIRPLVERCLRKDPRKRWRDIGDVRMALDEPAAEPPAQRRGVLIWKTIAAVLLLGVVAGQWALWQGPQTSARPFVQLDLDVGPDGVSQPALSPDGSVVVFVSKNRLVMRRLDQTANTVLVGTEGASFPFFSPDGKSVAFFADRKIKRIALQGGAPIPICDIATNRGGSWVEDGFIIAPMESLGGLWRIPVAGGTPQPLTSIKGDPEGMVAHRWPQVLPGGKGVLFAATSGTRGSLRVEAGGNVKTLVRNSTYGRLLPSGHLIYYQAGALFAAPMSLDSLELTGPAVALVERVAYTANVANAHFDVAPSGTLAYIRGAQETGRVVSWLDSAGRVAPILPKPADYDFLRLSPDGKRLAVMLAQEGKVDLWVYDLAREGFRQITFDGVGKAYPVWTPDPAFILFTTQSGLSWIRADGSGKVGRLEAAMVRPFPWSLSSDGARLAFADATGIRTLSMERTPAGLRLGQPEPPFQNGGGPAVSPDGRFLAYHSLPLGRSEINVMPFPGAAGTGDESRAGRWPISNEGGTWAIWPRSGREIFYVGPDRRIRAVSYTIQGNSFVSEKPRVWSENILADVGNGPNFDMDSSGQRAVVLIDPSGGESKPETQLRILLNLDDELSRRIAAPVRP